MQFNRGSSELDVTPASLALPWLQNFRCSARLCMVVMGVSCIALGCDSRDVNRVEIRFRPAVDPEPVAVESTESANSDHAATPE